MNLYQLLRKIRCGNAIVLFDSAQQIICKYLSKDEISFEYYEYNVLEFGSAISEFCDYKSCIYIIIDK